MDIPHIQLSDSCPRRRHCARELACWSKILLDRSRDIKYFTIMLINQAVTLDKSLGSLDAIFAALADPTRRSILARLSKGDAAVNDLALPFSLSLPAVSRHLKVLERAGLISRSRRAQSRPCHLRVDALRKATNWLIEYQELWADSLENLDTYLQTIQKSSLGS